MIFRVTCKLHNVITDFKFDQRPKYLKYALKYNIIIIRIKYRYLYIVRKMALTSGRTAHSHIPIPRANYCITVKQRHNKIFVYAERITTLYFIG